MRNFKSLILTAGMLLIHLFVFGQQQFGTIKGTINTSDGKHADYITGYSTMNPQDLRTFTGSITYKF